MIGDIFQPTHLVFILVVALLVLGPKRLPEVARSLGHSLRDFRAAISGENHDDDHEEPSSLNESELADVPPATPSEKHSPQALNGEHPGPAPAGDPAPSQQEPASPAVQPAAPTAVFPPAPAPPTAAVQPAPAPVADTPEAASPPRADGPEAAADPPAPAEPAAPADRVN